MVRQGQEGRAFQERKDGQVDAAGKPGSETSAPRALQKADPFAPKVLMSGGPSNFPWGWDPPGCLI